MDIAKKIELLEQSKKTLDSLTIELRKRGYAKAIAERNYRIALAKKEVELREKGNSYPANLVYDIARGQEAELRYASGSCTAVCRFTIAINRQFKKDETDFINCVAFGRTGETIAQYILKGRQVAISGNIRTGSYDSQDGTKKYTTDVVVENFEFDGKKVYSIVDEKEITLIDIANIEFRTLVNKNSCNYGC